MLLVHAVAGAIKASQDYSSGLMLAVYKLDAGSIILNTLLLRENLGTHPAADRVLGFKYQHPAALARQGDPGCQPVWTCTYNDGIVLGHIL